MFEHHGRHADRKGRNTDVDLNILDSRKKTYLRSGQQLSSVKQFFKTLKFRRLSILELKIA